MVEQAEYERTEQGFRSESGNVVVPRQEFPEVGDQYDRDVSVYGSNPSQRNTQWYDFTPSQRYVAIITSWAAVAESIAAGNIGQIDDETILIASYAAHDTAALDAGLEFVENDEYGLLKPLHDLVYGEGDIDKVGFTQHDIPKINVNDPDATFGKLYVALGGQVMDRATSAVSRATTFGFTAGSPSPYDVEKQGWYMEKMYDQFGDSLDPEGDIDAATAADLLEYANKYSHGEDGGKGAILQNGVDYVAPLLYDAMITGVVLAAGVGTLGLTGHLLTKVVPGVRSVTGPIVNGLRWTKKTLGFGSDANKWRRRTTQAGGLLISGGVIGGSIIEAAMETNEEALNALLRGTDSAESRDLLRSIWGESAHPIAYSLRQDEEGWYQNKDERRNTSIDEMRVQNAATRYGGGQQYQPGPEALREGYSFFNPEVRKARKDTSLEEIQSGESYNLNMYHENGSWDLR